MNHFNLHYVFPLIGFLFLISTNNSGATVTVGSVAALTAAIQEANNNGDIDIQLASGIYNLNGAYLRITRDGVTVKSASGKREDVILDGNYATTEIFQIVASHVTIANLRLQRAVDHSIHIMPNDSDVTGIRLHNLHIVDAKEQAIKINPDAGRNFNVNNGTISNCLIELTPEGRVQVETDSSNSHPCYTGGIDAHGAAGWQIVDNVIQGFWCSTGLSEHGIHFWSDSSNTVIERNHIIDCDRGIGFGLGSSMHLGGIIRNNMIYHPENHGHSDVGISLESAENVAVYNNTVYLDHDYPNAIEYRFPTTQGGFIRNNLCNRAIRSREGGTALLSNNRSDALAGWFVDLQQGDLHLNGPINGVVDSGAVIAGLEDDFDAEPRSVMPGIDIGADEFWKADTVNPSFLSFLPLLLFSR